MIGFIGAGNMGGALIRAQLSQSPHRKTKKSDKVGKNLRKQVVVFDPNLKTRQNLSDFRIDWCTSSLKVLQRSNIIFLCIKPKDVEAFFSEHRQYFRRHILISIIAGLSIGSLRQISKISQLKVCRIMPNLAAGIRQGTGTVTFSRNITTTEKKTLQRILSRSGLYIETPEPLVDAVTAISGCGPAFVFLFIEALTQAAMKLKIPRKQALRFTTTTVIGAGSLLQASGQEPLKLTSQVTSPGGMTIEGVNWLNGSDFQNIVEEAVFRAHAKAKKLFKNQSPNSNNISIEEKNKNFKIKKPIV